MLVLEIYSQETVTGSKVTATIPSVTPLTLNAEGKPSVQSVISAVTPVGIKTAKQVVSSSGKPGILKSAKKSEKTKSTGRKIRFDDSAKKDEGSTGKKPRARAKRKPQGLPLPEVKEKMAAVLRRRKKYYPVRKLFEITASIVMWRNELS